MYTTSMLINIPGEPIQPSIEAGHRNHREEDG
jgi:hypothetical protein